MTVTKPGVYKTMPKQVYNDDPCPQPSLRASLLSSLARSPRHAWVQSPNLNPRYDEWRAEKEERSGTKFDIGNAVHDIVLEGRDVVEVFDVKAWTKAADREARDLARAQGRLPLKADDCARVNRMLEAYEDQAPALAKAWDIDLAAGAPEVTMVWTEEVDGVTIWCRMRPDLVCPGDKIVDLKTSGDASPIGWGNRICWNTGAMIQAAFNRRGYERLTGRKPEFFDFVIEVDEPHCMHAFYQDPDLAETMDAEVTRLINMWARCIRENRWPGYPSIPTAISTPGWLAAQMMAGDRDALEQFAKARNKNVLDLLVEMQAPGGGAGLMAFKYWVAALVLFSDSDHAALETVVYAPTMEGCEAQVYLWVEGYAKTLMAIDDTAWVDMTERECRLAFLTEEGAVIEIPPAPPLPPIRRR